MDNKRFCRLCHNNLYKKSVSVAELAMINIFVRFTLSPKTTISRISIKFTVYRNLKNVSLQSLAITETNKAQLID